MNKLIKKDWNKKLKKEWQPIFDNMCVQIEDVLDRVPEKFCAKVTISNVKEKHGALSVQIIEENIPGAYAYEIENIVYMAQESSRNRNNRGK